MREDTKFYFSLFGYALLAAFGGLLGYLMRTLDKGHRVSYGRALIESASAGFVGGLVTLACMAMKLDPLWSGVIVGVFGWLGATASIRFLETMIFKRLGITRNEVREATNAQPGESTGR